MFQQNLVTLVKEYWNMKLDELEKAMELQRKAYGLLLWLKSRVRTNPAFLKSISGEPFASGEACAEWVRQRVSSFPELLRPRDAEIREFGFILSSFFGTSFRIAEVRTWERVETTIVAGSTSFRDRGHRRRAEQNHEHDALELRRLAMDELARENNFIFTAVMFDKLMATSEISATLTLWTYGRELVRRCKYASQGPAVHRLWLEIDSKLKKNLSVELVWKARGQLVNWLGENQIK